MLLQAYLTLKLKEPYPMALWPWAVGPAKGIVKALALSCYTNGPCLIYRWLRPSMAIIWPKGLVLAIII